MLFILTSYFVRSLILWLRFGYLKNKFNFIQMCLCPCFCASVCIEMTVQAPTPNWFFSPNQFIGEEKEIEISEE